MDFNDDGHICRCCNGRKVTPHPVDIREVCYNCGGSGTIDWVAHAMDGKGRDKHQPDHQFLYNVAQRNIQDLIFEIKRQGERLGMAIDVKVDFRREPTYEQMYLTRPSPMLFPPGTKIPDEF